MKKMYMTPAIKANSLSLQEFIAFSGGGVEGGDPQINDVPDDGNDPNRAPLRHLGGWKSVWED